MNIKHIKILTIFLPFILSACTNRLDPTTLPRLNPNEVHWFMLEQIDPSQQTTTHKSFLAIQGLESGNSRWIQSDGFGAPLARLIARPQGWQNDGFLAPNPAAQRLFSTLFPYIEAAMYSPQNLNFEGKTWRLSALTTEMTP